MIRFDTKFYEFACLLAWFVENVHPEDMHSAGRHLISAGVASAILYMHAVGVGSTPEETHEIFYNCLMEQYIGVAQN